MLVTIKGLQDLVFITPDLTHTVIDKLGKVETFSPGPWPRKRPLQVQQLFLSNEGTTKEENEQWPITATNTIEKGKWGFKTNTTYPASWTGSQRKKVLNKFGLAHLGSPPVFNPSPQQPLLLKRKRIDRNFHNFEASSHQLTHLWKYWFSFLPPPNTLTCSQTLPSQLLKCLVH